MPVVFFGPLPFVHSRPAEPYYIYTDGAFFIFYREYYQDHSHAQTEIERICAAEAEFMRSATGIWCSSEWVANRIIREYNFPKRLAVCVGAGPGAVPPPVEPVRYENFLVMIAADFERKQGRLAVEVVRLARNQGLDLTIKFIGAEPPKDVLSLPFVEYSGLIDLTKDGDRKRFAELVSRAGAQILLSRADFTPLAIPEAAIYAKNTMGSAVGGIPEMIRDGETGWLVQADSSREELAERVVQIFSQPERMRDVGAAARTFCAGHRAWEAVAERCLRNMIQP